ncbi:uncharacterized protein HKW66_Vig0088370 [Vigna angularis]|uniref:Uncharacterized protein n=1 Tax=Phaseolus angularis TaxID=3914 RepID=A0A8T0KI50_PHAAN|nr:uncharacterized protein HKW66_Vig0088370 [Vigna angularis]
MLSSVLDEYDSSGEVGISLNNATENEVRTAFLWILFQYVTLQKENGIQTTVNRYIQVLNASNVCQRCGDKNEVHMKTKWA